MNWTTFFELLGQIATLAAALVAGWWAYEKWRKRDEHFPRIALEVSANFVGVQSNQIVVEIVAAVENKGLVPLKYRTFGFKLRGIDSSDDLTRGDQAIRGQLLFPQVVAEGSFIPDHWDYSFVYPGVRTEYNFVTNLPRSVSFVRVQADMSYMLRGESHHAAKILRVPEFSPEGTLSSRLGHDSV